MKKIFLLLIFFISLSSKAYAKDEVFEHPNEALGEATIIKMPSCTDKAFTAKIVKTAQAYLDKVPSTNTLAKRQKFLKLKNLRHFENVPVPGFGPQQDMETANALMMIKINEHIDEKDIVLCRQSGVEKNAVYVIAYPYLNNVKAHLINLDTRNIDYNAVQFLYP